MSANMRVQTGKGTIPWMTVLAVWSVSAVVSLPGLAISPILGDLNKVFPHATDLEIQMLTSLPSVLIIPFMLLAGRLSVTGNKFKLLVVGLTVFFLSGFACLFINQMWLLILVSCLTGIGAGIIIPLSTGYIVDYFTGDYRVRQLGYSSSINNLTLVLATMLASYLANVDWHLPFLVYTLPAIPLILSVFIRRTPAAPEPVGSDELKHKKVDWPKLAAVMGFYFLATFLALAITFYISFLVDPHGNQNSFSGLLVSLFSWLSCCPAFPFPDHPASARQCQSGFVDYDLCGIALYRTLQGAFLVDCGMYSRGTRIRHYSTDYLRQGGCGCSTAIGDAGSFDRDVGELPGHRSLSVYHRSVAKYSAYAGRAIPVYFECGIGLCCGLAHLAVQK